MPHLFCFGLSYTARALVDRLNTGDGPDAWQITATVQTETKPGPGAQRRVKTHLFASAESHAALKSATHILSSVPPSADGDPVLAAYGDTLETVAGVQWIGYLSTTGPYGNHDGVWIDETTPDAPSGERGQRRLDTETAWGSLCEAANLPLHIFRLPGLYGPGRSALDRMRAGTARRIVKPGQVFSRIHIEDLATILAASMNNPRPPTPEGTRYNVADDKPAPPQDVITFAARLLGLTPPPEIPYDEADLSAMARSFYSDSKRISNRRIKSELGITLAYPTYEEGLRAILAVEKSR